MNFFSISGYCQKKDDQLSLCRFKFPFEIIGYEMELGEPKKVISEEGLTFSYQQPVRQSDKVQDGAEFRGKRLKSLRNHDRVVEHIPELLQIWRGNIDTKVISTVDNLLGYICKVSSFKSKLKPLLNITLIFQYVTKPEAHSESCIDIVKKVLEKVDDIDDTTKRTIQRICMSFLKEHDINRNEAHLYLNADSLMITSRPTIAVNLTDKRRVTVEKFLQPNTGEASALTANFADYYWTRETDVNYQRACEKYEEDPVHFPLGHPRDVSLYYYASLFERNWRYRGTHKCPVPTPQFSSVPDQVKEEAYNAYCEVTLLLHKPGTNPTNFLHKNLHDENSDIFMFAHEALHDFVHDEDSQCPEMIREEFKNALRAEEIIAQKQAGEGDVYFTPPEERLDIDELDPSPLDDTHLELGVDDELFGIDAPAEQRDVDEQIEDIMDMEKVDEDVHLEHSADHNWHEDRILLGLTNEGIKASQTWIKEKKIQSQGSVNQSDRVPIDPSTLNQNQRWIYDTAMEAIQHPEEQKFIDLCGGAGTGKSYLINAIIDGAEALYPDKRTVQPISPTGQATIQFADKGGKTIHSCFRIKVHNKKGKQTSIEELGEGEAQQLERDLAHLRLLIIDEKGMMGFLRLAQIDSRLRQARPQGKDKPFGGISVMIAGDLRQLPPVGDMPLYKVPTKKDSTPEHVGYNLYRMFDENTFKLSDIMRQRGAENEQFRKDLTDLAVNHFTEEQYFRWASFMNPKTMDPERWHEFENEGLKLAAKKDDLKGFNGERLLKLNKPICQSTAINRPAAAKDSDPNQAGNLMNELFLAKGARILLTRNLWTERGLVNGSHGYIRYIIFREGSDPNTSPYPMPDLLLVEFPTYSGPAFDIIDTEERLVPILPETASWSTSRVKNLYRIQFPILPGYAITIHKSQGMFFSGFSVKISERDHHFRHDTPESYCENLTDRVQSRLAVHRVLSRDKRTGAGHREWE